MALRDLGAMRTELERVDAVARSVDEWLASVVGGLRQHLPIDRATLRVVDPEDGEVVVVGQYVERPTAIQVGTRVPYRSTSFPRAVRERRPVMSSDQDQEFPLPLLDQILWEEGVRSWVSVPLRQGTKTVGLLSFSSPEPEAFSERDRLLFENIGLLCQDVLLALAYRRMIKFRD
ncbi:MAG: GAF domain-containing protein [Actinomycetota bacterium]|nr:GAF domain-containing protein [Actinomycetota bacterium]